MSRYYIVTDSNGTDNWSRKNLSELIGQTLKTPTFLNAPDYRDAVLFHAHSTPELAMRVARPGARFRLFAVEGYPCVVRREGMAGFQELKVIAELDKHEVFGPAVAALESIVSKAFIATSEQIAALEGAIAYWDKVDEDKTVASAVRSSLIRDIHFIILGSSDAERESPFWHFVQDSKVWMAPGKLVHLAALTAGAGIASKDYISEYDFRRLIGPWEDVFGPLGL